MKKFLSMILVLTMSMMFAVPSSTPPSDAVEEDYSIMPLATLFPQTPISGAGSYRSTDFTASSSNGNYIRFWFNNTTSEKVQVYLYRTDSGKDVQVKSMPVNGESQDQRTYFSTTANSGTYYIYIDAVSSGGTISGDLSVAQYNSNIP